MEKRVRRIDGKKVTINVFIMLALLIGAFVLSYSFYVADRLTAKIRGYETLVGRMYGDLDDDFYVLLEKNAVTVSENDVDTVYANFTWSDNILTLRETETVIENGEEREEERTKTFVFLKDERFFFADENRYLDLMWETVYE